MASDANETPQSANKRGQPIWHGPVAGAASSFASRVLTYPADTIKARQQLSGAHGLQGTSFSTLAAFQQVGRSEGIRGFYQGFGAVLAGVAPATALYFGGYESGKRLLNPSSGIAGDMLVGCYAQALAGVAFTPIDIIKERMQVQTMMGDVYNYRNAFHAFSSIVKQQGFRGLLKGYWATNSVWFPWNMIYIASYEQSRASLAQHLQVEGVSQLPGWGVAACSGGSAALAICFTHPLDVVKTRLQVLSAGAAGRSLTAVSVAKSLWASQGARGFGKGLLARTLTISPGAAIQWYIYEKVKWQLSVMH